MALTFNDTYYLSNNADVLAAVGRGTFATASQHYSLFGARELRNPNSTFNAREYVLQNDDLVRAFQNGTLLNPFQHYLTFGVTENRAPNAATFGFDAARYLSTHADVAAAVGTGKAFSSAMQHYLLFGATEGRAAQKTDGTPITGTAVGSTFQLTDKADNITGTSSNDTVIGVAGTGATYSAADVINGGAGTDTFQLVTDANISLTPTTFTSIETVSTTATAGAAVTMTGVTGVTSVVNNGSTGALTYTNVGSAAAVTIQNVTTNVATSVTYTDAALAGTADAIALSLSSVGATGIRPAVTLTTATPVANSLETLNISSGGTGTNRITLTTDGTQTSLKTINITGSTALEMRVAADNVRTSATVINASAATAAVTIGADNVANGTLGAANHSVTGGTGNDTIYFGANLNSSDTVDGGAGTDVLGVAAALTNAIMTNVKNFETVRIDMGAQGANGNVTQDASLSSLSAITTYQFVGGNTLTVNNAANNTTFAPVGAAGATLTVTLKDSTGLSDAVNVTLGGTGITTISDIAGLETLNLSNASTTAATIGTNSVVAKNVITGSGDITITNAISATQVDASAMTGKLSIIAGTNATNIAGGSGADTIQGNTATDTINGGAGNDVIILGAAAGNVATGADVIVTGAGNDTVRFVGSNNGAVTGAATGYATVPTITDFTVGTTAAATDLIALSANNADFAANKAGGAIAGLSKGTTTQDLTAADAIVVQSIAQNASAATPSTNVSFFKLTTAVATGASVAATAGAALGTATVTGLAADATYLGSYYDSTVGRAILFTFNTGANANGDTTFAANDFTTDTSRVQVVGAITMTAADYGNFGATNFAAAF